MPRPKKYPGHKIDAYRCYQTRKAKGEELSALSIQIDLEELHPEGTVSYRLIADWVKEFKNQDSRQAFLDSPFQWHCMEEAGLPWEASSFIMRMLGEAYRAMPRGVSVATGNTLITDIRAKESSVWPIFFPGVIHPDPTFREVIWWWRVHEAAPEIGQQVGEVSDIRWFADSFTFREIAHELLDLPLVTEDLVACLALKPWLNEERHTDYHEMVDFEVVLAVPRGGIYPFIWQAPQENLEEIPFLRSVNMDHPELLFSQQSDMNNAKWSNGRLYYSLDTGLQDSGAQPVG